MKSNSNVNLCKFCKKAIESKTAKLFCNQSCSAKYNNKKRGLNPADKANCKFCKKTFKFWKGQHKGLYCSNKCRGYQQVFQGFTKNTFFGMSKRKFLFEHIFKKPTCTECGQNDLWNNKFLKLQIDHINGDSSDNRFENLRVLCPNCHTQTSTWGNPNKKK
jgi:hypothetical protein